MNRLTSHILILALTILGTLTAKADSYQCRYCGTRYSSIASMTSASCPRHPNGAYKGRHQPFTGSTGTSNSGSNTGTATYYCSYCGTRYNSIASLTSASCPRHPNGAYKGRHRPFAGNPVAPYYCCYCGTRYNSIASLTSASCPRHPNGAYKGRHYPLE